MTENQKEGQGSHLATRVEELLLYYVRFESLFRQASAAEIQRLILLTLDGKIQVLRAALQLLRSEDCLPGAFYPITLALRGIEYDLPPLLDILPNSEETKKSSTPESQEEPVGEDNVSQERRTE